MTKREIDCLIATGTATLAGPQFMKSTIVLTLAKTLVAWGRKTAILVTEPTLDPAQVLRDDNEGIAVYRSSQPVSTLPSLSLGLGQPRILMLPNNLARYDLLQTPGLDLTIWLGEEDIPLLGDHWMSMPARLWADSRYVATVAMRLLQRPVETVSPPVAPLRQQVTQPTEAGSVAVIGARPRDGIALTLNLAQQRPDLRFIIIEWPRLTERERQYVFALAAACGNIDWRRPDTPAALITAASEARVVFVPSMQPIGHRDWICQMRQVGRSMLGTNLGALPDLIGDQGQCLSADTPADLWLQHLDRLRVGSPLAGTTPMPASTFDAIAGQLLSGS